MTKSKVRWNKTRLSIKLLFWAVSQAILFKIQPVLWSGLKTTFVTAGTALGSIANGVVALQVQTQLILVLIGLFTLQTTILLLKFNEYNSGVGDVRETTEEILVATEDIRWMVEDVESEVEDIRFDGGSRHDTTSSDDEASTTGTGALGGAVAGGAFGASVGGPAGAIGGALLGLIIGDEAEKSSIGQDRKETAKLAIIKFLLRTHSPNRAVSQRRIVKRLDGFDSDIVRRSIDELASDPQSLVEYVPSQEPSNEKMVKLINPGKARTYVQDAEE